MDLCVRGQPDLQSEAQDNGDFTEKPCLKKSHCEHHFHCHVRKHTVSPTQHCVAGLAPAAGVQVPEVLHPSFLGVFFRGKCTSTNTIRVGLGARPLENSLADPVCRLPYLLTQLLPWHGLYFSTGSKVWQYFPVLASGVSFTASMPSLLPTSAVVPCCHVTSHPSGADAPGSSCTLFAQVGGSITLVPVTECRFETKIWEPKDAAAQAVECLPSMLWAGCLCREVFRGWQTAFYLLSLSMNSAIFASQASNLYVLSCRTFIPKELGPPCPGLS